MTEEFEGNAKEKTRIDRRSLLLGQTAIVAGGVIAAQAVTAPANALSAPTPVAGAHPSTMDSGAFSVAIVGEALLTRPFSMQTEPEFQGLVKILRDADIAYCHLETNIASDEELVWAARGSSGGAGYLIGPPECAKDLAWAGIDVASLAMNHSYDWGPVGMLATIKHMKGAGITVAGTGPNLETARAPGYFESDKGRVGLISVASGNSAFEWAGHPKRGAPGRPGINPLRTRTVYTVPRATAAQLKAAGRSLNVLSAANAARPDFNITPGAISGSNGFSGFTWREGDRFSVTSEGNPMDSRANLRGVIEATEMADFVMVGHHNSTSEAGRGTTPSGFVVDFARKAIDAGADMYLGHGWHTHLGIEIYKGKPIFYGLGSFFWQSQFITRKPADQYESYNYDMDDLNSLNPAAGNLHPEGSEAWGWSAVYVANYVDNKLVSIVMHPTEMGYDFTGANGVRTRVIGEGEHQYLDGSPRLATGANAQAILLKIQKICADRGTKVDIVNGTGVIRVA